MRSDTAFEARRVQGRGPSERLRLVLSAQASVAQRRAVDLEVAPREGVRLGVQDDVDVALSIQRHLFRTMLRGRRKSEPFEQRTEACRCVNVDRELQKRNPIQ